MNISLKRLALGLASAGMLTIYGCGGGGSSDPTSTPSPTPAPATTPLPTPTAASGVAALPVSLISQPKAVNCAALRSGVYNFIVPSSAGILTNQISKTTIDAVALTATDSSGVTSFVASAGEACHFTTLNSTNCVNDMVVSPAGVIVFRGSDTATKEIGIGIPAQTYTTTDLDGDYNLIGMEKNNGVFNGKTVTATIKGGAVTAAKTCSNSTTWDVTAASCVVITSGFSKFTVNSDGGFNNVDPVDGITGRLFIYRSGSNDTMGIMISQLGGITLLTNQRTYTLPTVGTTTVSWTLQLNNNLTSPTALSATSNTVLSVDSVAGSWVRTNTTVGLNDTVNQTLFANNPRSGYRFRPAGSAVATDGSTQTIREVTSLEMYGMGLNVVLIPSVKRFQFSVTQP